MKIAAFLALVGSAAAFAPSSQGRGDTAVANKFAGDFGATAPVSRAVPTEQLDAGRVLVALRSSRASPHPPLPHLSFPSLSSGSSTPSAS